MKKYLAFLMALAIFLTLCACGGTAAAPEASSGTDAAAEADGTVYNLVVVNHDASTSMCEKYIETLCGQMSEASGGRLTFTFQPGGSLLGATETIDGVKDGSADMCWSCTSFFSARFPIAEFINLCANGCTSARMATDVFQDIYNEIPEAAAEFADWKVVGLHACSYGPVSTVGKKIEKPEDFKGMLIRTAGTVASQYIEALGATPMTVPTSDVYENISKGVIDGFTNDWHNIDCFKLYEPIDYCLNLPISYTSCFVLMNKNTYDKLPDDLKAIIDEYSGNYAGDMAGYWWDSCRYWVADEMKANGVDVYEPSDELKAWAQSEEITGPIHEWYIKYLTDAGLDGQAIYDKCNEIVAKNAEAHAGDWDAEFNYADWNYTPATYGK